MMKRVFATLLLFSVIFTSGCRAADPEKPEPSKEDGSLFVFQTEAAGRETTGATMSEAGSEEESLIDLTKLSRNMVYADVYSMIYAPESFIGKSVRMKGRFAHYEDPDSGEQLFSCVVTDAAACCSQGLGFVLAGEKVWPDDYPEPGSEITVSGTFAVYERRGSSFCRLENAVLEN